MLWQFEAIKLTEWEGPTSKYTRTRFLSRGIGSQSSLWQTRFLLCGSIHSNYKTLLVKSEFFYQYRFVLSCPIGQGERKYHSYIVFQWKSISPLIFFETFNFDFMHFHECICLDAVMDDETSRLAINRNRF